MTDTLKVRLDKWLWAARFFKTRCLATQAVNGGKVHCNAKRVKAARVVMIGDELRIQRDTTTFTVIVIGINDKRRPAAEAVTLYTETVESIEAREQTREQNKLFRVMNGHLGPVKKPNKRDRRLIKDFIGKT